MLTQHGWQVEVAESGEKTVSKWEKEYYDLILMDIKMPEKIA